MNYYRRHVGDYLKRAAHLSLLEHGVYARLMDVYVVNEEPIPADRAAHKVGARTTEEIQAVQSVLEEFFVLDGDVWRHQECDEQIESYAEMAERNRATGKLGGRPPKPKRNPVGFDSEPTGKPPKNQEPITKEPEEEPPVVPRAVARPPRATRRCPADFVVTDEMRAWARAEAPWVDVDAETAKLRDHEFGKARSDWPATWRNWIRRAGEQRPQQRAPPPPQSRYAATIAGLTGRNRPETIDVTATESHPRRLAG